MKKLDIVNVVNRVLFSPKTKNLDTGMFAVTAKSHLKTTNMGTLYELQYRVTFRETQVPKEFLDALRCRNGNLNIVCAREENREAL